MRLLRLKLRLVFLWSINSINLIEMNVINAAGQSKSISSTVIMGHNVGHPCIGIKDAILIASKVDAGTRNFTDILKLFWRAHQTRG